MATAEQVKEFWAVMAPHAVQAHKLRPGLFPEVALLQWADESAYGTSSLATGSHNFAGITTGDGKTYITYRDAEAFVSAYAFDLGLKYYTGVLDAKTVETQLVALGNSPWAAGQYREIINGEYGAPGTALLGMWNENKAEIEAALQAVYDAVKTTPAHIEQPKKSYAVLAVYDTAEKANKLKDAAEKLGLWIGVYEQR